jgi:hypothetical protein
MPKEVKKDGSYCKFLNLLSHYKIGINLPQPHNFWRESGVKEKTTYKKIVSG